MVRALLAGTKTQTRRVVKPQPDWLPEVRETRRTDSFVWPIGALGQQCGAPLVKLPYGAPGDRLWVRETCRAEEMADGYDGVRYLADDHWQKIDNTVKAAERWFDLLHYDRKRRPPGSKVPGIHMPRWASRLTLTITDVRVERLQDISPADAEAEGVRDLVSPDGARGWNVKIGNEIISNWVSPTRRDIYETLWEHINGPGSWAANPWVWAVSFEVER